MRRLTATCNSSLRGFNVLSVPYPQALPLESAHMHTEIRAQNKAEVME